MSTDLRDALADRLDTVTAPPGDLVGVMRDGRRIRTRRRAAVAGVVAATLAVGGLAVTQLMGPSDTRAGEGQVATDPVVRAADGLRAYFDPGGDLRYGGLTVPSSRFAGLDTDAAATPAGVVYYHEGRPVLLDLDGNTMTIEGAGDTRRDWHPTAKADSTSSEAAVAILSDGEPRILVLDTGTREVIGMIDVVCGGCDVVIDAFDDGAVFFRDGTGTKVWDLDGDFTRPFAGPGTSIADVRNGVVLYDGAVPEPEPGVGQRDYTFVRGAIDSQLTHDGAHVLAWSSTLEPTGAGSAEPLQLSVTERDSASQWTVDTDGSILVASRAGSATIVSDCDPVTGACERIDVLEVTGGDLGFLGNDM
ncbi:hypothetical protein [Nocardioides sp. Soil805]|uniref:hypothetical protein n=1 Tax=Nocardioides sp. Soil805 TaxID=1736416 RepID=UPI000702BED7|nr:hypothetical protein [Nocardioides sp. Soil805]KRF36695.1 hypothetical protein ASG94_04525 [Nocardioides sp. Soil805]